MNVDSHLAIYPEHAHTQCLLLGFDFVSLHRLHQQSHALRINLRCDAVA
jgi:hypothetical protein